MKICVVTVSSALDAEEVIIPDLRNYIDRERHSVELAEGPLDLEWITALRYLNTKYLVGIGSLSDSTLSLCAENLEKSQACSLPQSEGGEPSTSELLLPGHSRKHQDGDYSVLVVLFGQTAFALTPLEYREYQSSLKYREEATWMLMPASDLSGHLRATAVSAFEKIRGTEYLGYMSANLHVNQTSGLITVTSLDPAPQLFYPQGSSRWDTRLIPRAIPGGHAALFEILLSARLARIPHYVMRNEGCARQHDRLARLYYTILDSTNVTHNRLTPFVGNYDYNGTVLDCCSGSGEFARFATERGVQATYSALDYSVEMTELPYSKKLYQQPFIIGPVQEVLASAPERDHVVCFGSLHLLQPFDFVSTLSQLFLRAKKSVTFDVDDLSQTYIQDFPKASSEKCWEKLEYNHNNVAQVFRFGVPFGWKAVVNGERRYAYRSLVMKEDVHTHSFRFERML